MLCLSVAYAMLCFSVAYAILCVFKRSRVYTERETEENSYGKFREKERIVWLFNQG